MLLDGDPIPNNPALHNFCGYIFPGLIQVSNGQEFSADAATTEMLLPLNKSSGNVTMSTEGFNEITVIQESPTEVALTPIERFDNMSFVEKYFYMPTYFAYRCPLEMTVYCQKWVLR